MLPHCMCANLLGSLQLGTPVVKPQTSRAVDWRGKPVSLWWGISDTFSWFKSHLGSLSTQQKTYCFFCACWVTVWKLTEELPTARPPRSFSQNVCRPFLKDGSPEVPQTPLIGSEGPDTPLIGSAVGGATGEPAGTSTGQPPASAWAWPVTPSCGGGCSTAWFGSTALPSLTF